MSSSSILGPLTYGAALRYLNMIQYVPLNISIVAAVTMKYYGYSNPMCLLTVGAGTLLASLLLSLAPLTPIAPVGGFFNVGMKHVVGNRATLTPPVVCYYPTNDSPSADGVPYAPFNDKRFIDGIAQYGGVPAFLVSYFMNIRTMATFDAAAPTALAPKPEASSNAVSQKQDPFSLVHLPNGSPRPIVLFSHGLGGFHQLYSCLALDLAARGAIVINVLHGDASAAFYRDANDDGSKESVIYFKKLPMEEEPRKPQLQQRAKEVRRALTKLMSGDYFREMGFTEKQIEEFVNSKRGVTLSGHSFGGATVLSAALEEERSEKAGEQRRVTDVVVFDPWHVPIQNELFVTPIEDGSATYSFPTLMIFSQEWNVWKESTQFFDVRLNTALTSQKGYKEAAAAKAEAQKRKDAIINQPGLSMQTLVSKIEEIDKAYAATKVCGPFVSKAYAGTDHLWMTDVSVISPVVMHKPYARGKSRPQLMEWANRTLEFVKKHE